MDKLRINYIDYWATIPKQTFYFTRILRKYYDVIIEDDVNKCDVLFTGPFGNSKTSINHPLKIYYTGENTLPDYDHNAYCFTFHQHTHPKHVRLPIYYTESNFLRIKQENRVMVKPKLDFCCFLVSNGNGHVRNSIYQSLSSYKKVDSGGRHWNNIGGVISPQDTINWQSKYKFTISCENAMSDRYITEKIVNAYNAGTVPIYWGSKTVKEELNPKAFVNVNDFMDINHLVEYIIELDNNSLMYEEMLNQPLLKGNEYNEEFTEDAIALKLKNIIEGR